MNPLEKAIDALYAAFEDVRKPGNIPGCRCPACLSQEEVRTLLSKPLRELSDDELSEYQSGAFLTCGSVADYLYFLPRLVEIATEDGYPMIDPEYVGRAIGETNFSEWPENRQTALQSVIRMVMTREIVREDSWSLDSWICAIGLAGIDLTPYLKQIEDAPKSLLNFYAKNSAQLLKGKLSNSLWNKDLPAYQTVLTWFQSPKVSIMIAHAYGITDPCPS